MVVPAALHPEKKELAVPEAGRLFQAQREVFHLQVLASEVPFPFWFSCRGVEKAGRGVRRARGLKTWALSSLSLMVCPSLGPVCREDRGSEGDRDPKFPSLVAVSF